MRVMLSMLEMFATPRLISPTSCALQPSSSSSAVGNALVPILFFSLCRRIPFRPFGDLGSFILARKRLRPREPLEGSVLARIMATSPSVALENHLNPWRVYQSPVLGVLVVSAGSTRLAMVSV